MIAAEDVRLVQETVEALRARGDDAHARAVKAVLEVALSFQPDERAPERKYMTTGQAASLLGVSRQTIVNWVAARKLPGARLGGRTMALRQAVVDRYRALVASSVPNPPRRPEHAAAERRMREFILKDLLTDKRKRLEALHETMEDGQPLSRSERAEMARLEREIMTAASDRLEAWIRSRQSASR
jgi:excisionase family DNA binding protein